MAESLDGEVHHLVGCEEDLDMNLVFTHPQSFYVNSFNLTCSSTTALLIQITDLPFGVAPGTSAFTILLSINTHLHKNCGSGHYRECPFDNLNISEGFHLSQLYYVVTKILINSEY